MKFRLKAFALHLLGSLAALSLILGALYLGWYRWPGWYLANALTVVVVLIGVDLVAGPLLTAVIANERKPRRELARDLGVIVAVQLCALAYGVDSLWNGRPLFYAYSESILQIIQASDIDARELALARQQHVELVPHWYSLPRWIWVPLPDDETERNKIMADASAGGLDVISMPRYYKQWQRGLATLQRQLKPVEDLRYFSVTEKKTLQARMRAAGLATDQMNSIPLTGRGPALLAVFEPGDAKLLAIIKAR